MHSDQLLCAFAARYASLAEGVVRTWACPSTEAEIQHSLEDMERSVLASYLLVFLILAVTTGWIAT